MGIIHYYVAWGSAELLVNIDVQAYFVYQVFDGRFCWNVRILVSRARRFKFEKEVFAAVIAAAAITRTAGILCWMIAKKKDENVVILYDSCSSNAVALCVGISHHRRWYADRTPRILPSAKTP